MFVVDAHQDIAFNAICFGRDYRQGAIKKRRLEQGSAVVQMNGVATVGLPEALVGRVALVFATLFVAPMPSQGSPTWAQIAYETPRQAHDLALRQLDYYQRLADEDARIELVRTAAELDAVLATWEDGKDISQRKQGIILLMENADPIIEPKQFEEWYERGVRIVGPAWQATRYAGGTGMPGGLTRLGRELLDVMQGLNAVLDVSHLAEEAFFDALDQYEGTIIASHSNPRRFADTDRHLSDTMIRRLAERDGVMGVVLYNRFLDHTWTSSDKKRAIPLVKVIDVVDHICQLTGSSRHVGIGSDFDGGFGAESIPYELDTVADVWQLKDGLHKRGFDDADIALILGGNMVRKLRECLS